MWSLSTLPKPAPHSSNSPFAPFAPWAAPLWYLTWRKQERPRYKSTQKWRAMLKQEAFDRLKILLKLNSLLTKLCKGFVEFRLDLSILRNRRAMWESPAKKAKGLLPTDKQRVKGLQSRWAACSHSDWKGELFALSQRGHSKDSAWKGLEWSDSSKMSFVRRQRFQGCRRGAQRMCLRRKHTFGRTTPATELD